MWAKPLPDGAWALLAINTASNSASEKGAVTIDLAAEFGATMKCGGGGGGGSNEGNGEGRAGGSSGSAAAGCSVRDLWAQADSEPITDGIWKVGALAPHDSQFVRITPSK